MKKFASLLLALVIVLSLALPAFAQTVDSGKSGSASITISNAAKGETYKLYKLFDAALDGTAITYSLPTGLTEIPAGLTSYFTIDSVGNIHATDAAKASDGSFSANAVTALTTWANSAESAKMAEAEADGSALVFTNLPYGLYIVTTTQGTVITVDSTKPDATVFDKNNTVVKIDKSVADSNLSIGDTATYTAIFNSSNYLTDEDGKSWKVTKYVISDTLPNFLSNVQVTSLKIDNDPDSDTDTLVSITTADGKVPQFDSKKSITISWVDADENHLYDNGAEIEITYTGIVTNAMQLDGTTTDNDGTEASKPIGNINTVTVEAKVEDGDTDKPWDKKWSDSEEIFTYAAALKKVADTTNGKALVGAEFKGKGLTVQEVKPGEYNVVSYDATSESYGTAMTTDINGYLVIKGLASDLTITLEETKAPAGYNKTDDPITLTPTVVGSIYTVTSKAVYYDANGNVVDQESSATTTKWELEFSAEALKTAAVSVVNKAGSELPSTGGMGTTLFYIVGAGLMLAAAVLLVTKKRMSNN